VFVRTTSVRMAPIRTCANPGREQDWNLPERGEPLFDHGAWTPHPAKVGSNNRVTEEKHMPLVDPARLGLQSIVKGRKTNLGTHVRRTPRTTASAQSPKASTQ